ncbi:MAG TPA: amidohydrolase family protein, partial [Chloroflexota bacterium]
MAKNGFKVMDSDMHIMEPPDLWPRYIDPEFKDIAPRGRISENVRDLRLIFPNDPPGADVSLTRPASGTPNRGHNFDRNQDLYRDHSQRGWTADCQLEAMDREGLDVAVLFPTRGLTVLTHPNQDPRFAAAIARAYNDWLYDFCKLDNDRLLGSGMLSVYDVKDAVAEAHRCAKELGFKAVFLRSNVVNG